MTLQSPPEVATADQPWVVLADARSALRLASRQPSWWLYARVAAAAVAVMLIVGIAAAGLSRQEAQREAVVDATQRAVVLAAAVMQPAIDDGVVSGSPTTSGGLDAVVRQYVLDDSVVRVKLWSADGRIIYSDQPGLVGERYELEGPARAVLLGNQPPTARISDLSEPENRFEADEGKLLEVYTRVASPDGQPLLFETYLRYDGASRRVGEIWRGFALITYSSLALLLLLLLPIIWQLVVRLRRTQEEREMLLLHAAETSAAERRRIAATLHDGLVQDLAGTAFVLSGAAGKAERAGESSLVASLNRASEAVRSSIGGLRSLLVEIYPPSLCATGIDAVLIDLVQGPTTRGLEVELELPEVRRTRLDRQCERLVFRVAQECLRNVARHACASRVTVRLRDTGTSMVLSVSDDGVGFDPRQVLQGGRPDQYGLRLMGEAAREAGAQLRVRSAAGRGTHWELEVAAP